MLQQTWTSIAKSKACLLLSLSLVGAGALQAQAYTPPPPPLQLGPCVPTKDLPCDPPKKAPAPPAATVSNPFPGEPAVAPAAASAQSTPNANSGTDKNQPASSNPFPGEPADSSSSSSSSSPSDDTPATADDTDKAGLKDKGSEGSTRFQRKKLAVSEDLSKRELDDLEVAQYYVTTGDYLGSYARAQDAVKLYPDDELAHYALGLAADKMKKKDEAIAEYKVYLKMAPDGTKAKQVQRALDQLESK